MSGEDAEQVRNGGVTARTSIEATLKNIPFFQHLTDEQLRDLANTGRTQCAEANRKVFREGDPADALYVILDGQVKVYKSDAERNEVLLSTLAKGDFFGEMALFDGAPRSATVSTLVPCEFFVLGRTEFVTLLGKSPRLISELLAAMSSKIRGVNEIFFLEVLEKQTLRAEMERERHRALAQMVAGVAHEVNTPLGIINTAASIIRERLTPETAAAMVADEESKVTLEDILEAAKLIQAHVERVRKLVQSFKNLSISQITDTKETVDLPALVKEIITLYQPQARVAHLQIEIISHLDDQQREWLGYPGYLTQIILNLLSNIERYAYPDGTGGKIEIGISAKDNEEKPSFILTVRDFGCGIAPADLSKVFEVFFTTGRHKGGTGLGLAIVRNLVADALKGSIEITSEPNQGTTVVITFPPIISE